MAEAALRKRIADLQERNETLEASLRAANDEISRLRAGADAASRHLDASEDAAAWVSSQLQLHDREQASQRLLLTICELLQVPEPAGQARLIAPDQFLKTRRVAAANGGDEFRVAGFRWHGGRT